MVRFYTTVWLSIIMLLALDSQAQNLTGLFPKAHYKMINTAADALGLNPPITLQNLPFQGSEGVYSNGLYIGDNPNGSWMTTASLDALYETKFAIQLEFKVEVLDGTNRTVFVCGDNSRYIGLAIRDDNIFQVMLNDEYINIFVREVEIDTWYKVTLIYDHETIRSQFYLDSSNLTNVIHAYIRPGNDGEIMNSHPGNGDTFQGNLRNLKVFGSDQIISSVKEDLEVASLLHLSPNPFKEHLNAAYHGTENYKWNIYDLNGKVIKEGEDLKGSQDIYFTSNAPGLYIFGVVDAKGNIRFQQQIVKAE